MSNITDRRLIGRLWHCEAWPDCECVQPVIEEHYFQRGEEHIEPVWYGTFLNEASDWELEDLRLELAEAAKKHRLEEDGFEPDRYEREL